MTDEVTSQNLTKPVPFEPNDDHIRWMCVAIEKHTLSAVRIARELGEDQSKFYDWRKIPGFWEWWQGTWREMVPVLQKEAILIGLSQAKRGRFDFWDRLLEVLKLKEPEEKTPQQVQQVNIIADALTKGAAERGVVIDGTG